MIGKSIEELKIGDVASRAKTISESDIYMFAGITGDFNPVHVNQEYASESFFKDRIAHGILVAGFISAVIAMDLPGPGTIYLDQTLQFKNPVYIGDTISALIEVVNINTEKNRVFLKTTCINQKGELVIDGQAQVLPPKKKNTAENWI
ncbi:MAG: MaoC family dehydratase [Deltaproteobacteria bacterium]|nr:MaoC family dehydratase [Deltaproteobacteria bacterium]